MAPTVTRRVATYLAIGVVWVYWAIGSAGDEVSGDRVLLLTTVGVHAADGCAIGRWWAVLVPLLWVATALPAGDAPEGSDGVDPVWVVKILTLHFDLAPAALGVAARKLLARRGSALIGR